MKNKYILLILLPLLSAGSIFATEAGVQLALARAIQNIGGSPNLYVINSPTPTGLITMRINIIQADYSQVLPHVITDLEGYAKTDYNIAETQLINIRQALQTHKDAQYTGIWTNLLAYCGKAPRLVTRTIDPQIEDVNIALRNIYWAAIITKIANKKDNIMFITYQVGKFGAIAAVAGLIVYSNKNKISHSISSINSYMSSCLPAFCKAAAKST